MEGVIAFAKGRSLERLRAFELAAQEYQLAAELDPELAVEAGRSRDVCMKLAEITEMGVGLDELAASVAIDIDADAMSDRYDERARLLAELARLTDSSVGALRAPMLEPSAKARNSPKSPNASWGPGEDSG